MTTKKDQIPPERRVTLSPNGHGVIAGYGWKVYRFLLDDGSTLDVIAIRDDSDLRAAVLEHTKAERIAGVATIGEHIIPDKRLIRRTKSGD